MSLLATEIEDITYSRCQNICLLSPSVFFYLLLTPKTKALPISSPLGEVGRGLFLFSGIGESA